MNVDYMLGLVTIPVIAASSWCLWAVWTYGLRPNPWRCRICDQRRGGPILLHTIRIPSKKGPDGTRVHMGISSMAHLRNHPDCLYELDRRIRAEAKYDKPGEDWNLTELYRFLTLPDGYTPPVHKPPRLRDITEEADA